MTNDTASAEAVGVPAAGPLAASRRWRHIELAAGILVISAIFFWLQFSTAGLCCGDFDSYYHIQWSRLLGEGLLHGSFPPVFKWLPLTSLNPTDYADQHFLFHLLLMPFTWIGDLQLAAKLAAALFGAAAVFSVYWLMLRYRISDPFLWLLALLGCSAAFYVRLNETRAQGLSLIFLVAGIVLLLERKYAWLCPVAFLYAWAYNLFVLIGLMAFLWTIVVWWSERRLEYRPLLWTGVGMVGGFVINPYFPKNVHLLLEHIVNRSVRIAASTEIGTEWLSLPGWDFLKGSLVASAAMLVGFIAFGYVLSLNRGRRVNVQRPLFFLLLSTALLVMAIRYVRFLEYWPPFAVLFAAFAVQGVQQARLDPQVQPLGQSADEPSVQTTAPSHRSAKFSRSVGLAALALFLAGMCVHNLLYVRMGIRLTTPDPNWYAAGAQWLHNSVPAGTLIYDLRYSDFPKLFFYDTAHPYVSGLDPLYLRDRYPELAELEFRLLRGQDKDPANAIRSAFVNAGVPTPRYIFIGSVPTPFSREWLDYIRQGNGFDVVYEDPECMILRLR